MRRRFRALIDFGAWGAALYLATLLRVDFSATRMADYRVLLLLPFALVTQAILGYATRLYRGGQLYGSYDEISLLAGVVFSTGLVLFAVDLTNTRLAPLSAVVGGTLIAFLLMGGVRFIGRRRRRAVLKVRGQSRERVLVFGAGDGCQRLLIAMLQDPKARYLPVALLDDDPEKAHLSVLGVPVAGDRFALKDVARRFDAALLVVAVPSATAQLVRDLAQRAALANLPVRVLPSVNELLAGQVRIVDMRPPNESDLLGRHHIDTDVATVASSITGKRVLVTGGGGSIGSELCRQLVGFDPERLYIVDRDESALHAVQLSIEGRALLDNDDLVLLDIRDEMRLQQAFEELKPDLVFHAAALKHLPLLEMYPAEALKSNVWGTLSVLEAAANAHVERFVNISTDKAANPASVLGYSKRIAERLTAWAGETFDGTYMSVRFGNVLGSRGSVLTAFREQIAMGGPITVTDRDVTRYFMTVEEAVQLVIQATEIGEDGQVLVLDMGEPVRIAEVARRLAEAAPRPIDIVFTGLRPGEKLHEELFAADEVGLPSAHPLLHYVDAPPLDPMIVRNLDARVPDDLLRTTLAGLCAYGSVAGASTPTLRVAEA